MSSALVLCRVGSAHRVGVIAQTWWAEPTLVRPRVYQIREVQVLSGHTFSGP
jgi:hypothetical protein